MTPSNSFQRTNGLRPRAAELMILWLSRRALLKMKLYDPELAPDPDEWLALPERERLRLVENAHDDELDDLPNPTLHFAMHVAVETQVAMGEQLAVAGELRRLISEGLSRHQAVHAVASVLAEHLFKIMKHPVGPARDPNEAYYSALRRLSARKWRDS